MNKFAQRALVAASALVVSGVALADDSGAVAAVTTAKTDGLAVAAAMLGMVAAIWGAMFIARKFFGGK